MKIGPLQFFRYPESPGWYCNWTCPFCGSASLSALFLFLIFGTRKLHNCDGGQAGLVAAVIVVALVAIGWLIGRAM